MIGARPTRAPGRTRTLVAMRRVWLYLREQKPARLAILTVQGLILMVVGFLGASASTLGRVVGTVVIVVGLVYVLLSCTAWALAVRDRRRAEHPERTDSPRP